VIDLYSTDAKIERYRITVLDDDRRYFPAYDAVLLYRADAPGRFPEAFAAWKGLEGKIDNATMVRLNARAEIDKLPFAQVAAEFLGASSTAKRTFWSALFAPDFGRLLAEHLMLVFRLARRGDPGRGAARHARGAAALARATRAPRHRPGPDRPVARAARVPDPAHRDHRRVAGAHRRFSCTRCCPSRGTLTPGSVQVPRGLVQSGTALGLTPARSSGYVKLPLALPTIMAGIKTSAVINVGTATIAAFIGAGGFGERISQGPGAERSRGAARRRAARRPRSRSRSTVCSRRWSVRCGGRQGRIRPPFSRSRSLHADRNSARDRGG
jgi:osmoprotectant transport system permease protein